jgi:hypothetical protein
MLKKSTISAIVMSGIACASAVLTFLFWETLLRSSPANFLAISLEGAPRIIAILCISLLVLLILVVLPGAFLIRDWSDEYYGIEGAIRWGFLGVIFGSLAQLRILIPEGTPEEGSPAFLLEKALSFLLGLIILFIAHILAFNSFKRNRRVE